MEEFKKLDSTEMKRKIRNSIILSPILVAIFYFLALFTHTYEYTGGLRIAKVLYILQIAPPWFWAVLVAAYLIWGIRRDFSVYKQRKQQEVAQEEHRLDQE